MKKISSTYFLYILQVSFIGLFILVLLGYNLQMTQKSFLENRMYSSNVKGIQLSDYQFPENVDLEMPETGSEFMLYRYLTESDRENIRAVYGSCDVFDLGKYIANGRFFSEDDYVNKMQTAVVGSGILPMTLEKDGTRYYAYNTQMYEVIGVFENTNSDLDNTAYLNLTRLLEDENNIGLYYIDAKDKSTVDTVIEKMKSNVQNKYSTMDIEYESTVSYEISVMFNTLLIFSVLAGVFSLLITTIFFVTHQKYTVSIQKLCGMTRKSLMWQYGAKNLLATALSVLIIIFSMVFLTNLENSVFAIETLSLNHYIFMGILLLLLCFLITYFTVKLADKVNISEVLKGI